MLDQVAGLAFNLVPEASLFALRGTRAFQYPAIGQACYLLLVRGSRPLGLIHGARRYVSAFIVIKALIIALELRSAGILSRGILPGSRVVALLVGVFALRAGTTLPARIVVIAARSRSVAALAASELLAFAPAMFKWTPLVVPPVFLSILLETGRAASSPVFRAILLITRRAIGPAIIGVGAILLVTRRAIISPPGSIAIG
jgi:hypothetical protein